jgi:hypothetical protein
VTAASSNASLIAPSGIFLGGSGATRSLLLTPVSNASGSTTMTITVIDSNDTSTSTTFVVSVGSTTPSNVPNDFNSDGSQDIIFQDNGGFVAAWYMSGDDVLSTTFLTPNNVGDANWKIVGTGDFNKDGKPDLLYQHTDGSLAVWYMNGVTMTANSFLNPTTSGAAWKAVATGDFTLVGNVDILFQHTDTTLAIWYMNGINVSSTTLLKPATSGAGWAAVGTGDLNSDGNLDIVFQHSDGTLAVWYLVGGNNVLLTALLNPKTPGDANWRVMGTIDLNGDKKTDLLFQNRADNSLAVWYMNGPNLILGKLLNPSNAGGTWKIVAP